MVVLAVTATSPGEVAEVVVKDTQQKQATSEKTHNSYSRSTICDAIIRLRNMTRLGVASEIVGLSHTEKSIHS